MCFFATKVTVTKIVASFIPHSPLHFITFSAISACLCDTFPKFGDLISHRDNDTHCNYSTWLDRTCIVSRGLLLITLYLNKVWMQLLDIYVFFFLTRSLPHHGNSTQRITSTRSILSVDINEPIYMNDGLYIVRESQRYLGASGYVSRLVNP